MSKIEFEGDLYNDDRIYVLKIRLGKCQNLTGITQYTFSEPVSSTKSPEYKWCLTTHRNTERYPITRVDSFDSKEDAEKYLRGVEPSTPLISLDGKRSEMTYDEFINWKKKQGLKEYDMNKLKRIG